MPNTWRITKDKKGNVFYYNPNPVYFYNTGSKNWKRTIKKMCDEK